ncbi:MAG: DUF177 domain-containing protein [Candidatus Omnitrophica bacterium]|nr:DUF177 domain-containing protein [Candidatus Omnitrophota bacterium]MCM8826914.1 DUF177 domain-containing protein [Candidatus Omnitrophota bacterium]
MRIEQVAITSTPIHLEEDIEAKEWDLDSFDIKFIKNIHLNFEFVRVGKEIVVKGKAITRRIITCSRCLEEKEEKVSYNIILSYNSSSIGDYLEIDNDVREEILLNFPMKVLCHNDCKGICPSCGVNLNYQVCKCKQK